MPTRIQDQSSVSCFPTERDSRHGTENVTNTKILGWPRCEARGHVTHMPSLILNSTAQHFACTYRNHSSNVSDKGQRDWSLWDSTLPPMCFYTDVNVQPCARFARLAARWVKVVCDVQVNAEARDCFTHPETLSP